MKSDEDVGSPGELATFRNQTLGRRRFLKWLGLAPVAAAATLALQRWGGMGEKTPHTVTMSKDIYAGLSMVSFEGHNYSYVDEDQVAGYEAVGWKRVSPKARRHYETTTTTCPFRGTPAQVDKHRYQALGHSPMQPEGTPVQFDPPYLRSSTEWSLRKPGKKYLAFPDFEGWRGCFGRGHSAQ